MKNIIIKTAALLVSFAALLSFSACSNNNNNDNGAETSSTSHAITASAGITDTNAGRDTATEASGQIISGTTSPSSSGTINENTSTAGTGTGVTSLTEDTGVSSETAGISESRSGGTAVTDAVPSQTVEFFKEYKDTRLAKFFKDYDMSNVYIKVDSEKKDGRKATREYASKDGAVYSSLEDKENKVIFLSIKNVTYYLEPKEKTYTVNALGSLALEYIYERCIGAGTCEFNGKDCVYEAFYDNDSGSIMCHMFDSKGNWVGYEEYDDTDIIQTNYVKAVSRSAPSHIFFEIPKDYKYYYEPTVVTWPSDWD